MTDRKKSNWTILVFLLALILVFVLGFMTNRLFNQTPKSNSGKVYDFLEKYYYKGFSSEDKEKAFLYELQGIVSSLDDPYTRINKKENATTVDTRYGLGIYVGVTNDGLVIRDVIKTSDSFKKLFINDIILGVIENDTEIYFKGMNIDKISGYLSSKVENEDKKLIVKHPSNDFLDKTIIIKTKKSVGTELVTNKKIDANTGYIRLEEFSHGTGNLFVSNLNELENLGMNKLVIDLRDNPGGSLNELNTIIGALLVKDNTPIYGIEAVYENGFNNESENIKNTDVYYGGLNAKKNYDIKVLVNNNSASASEVLSSALKYHGNYELIGEETYGKGLYQNTVELKIANEIWELTYTEGYWNYYYENGNKLANVMKRPLEVSSVSNINTPVFYSNLSTHTPEFRKELIDIQKILNIYCGIPSSENGKFDGSTKTNVEAIQTDGGHTTNYGVIDFATYKLIYIYYQDIVYPNIIYDYQLQRAIS